MFVLVRVLAQHSEHLEAVEHLELVGQHSEGVVKLAEALRPVRYAIAANLASHQPKHNPPEKSYLRKDICSPRLLNRDPFAPRQRLYIYFASCPPPYTSLALG